MWYTTKIQSDSEKKNEVKNNPLSELHTVFITIYRTFIKD